MLPPHFLVAVMPLPVATQSEKEVATHNRRAFFLHLPCLAIPFVYQYLSPCMYAFACSCLIYRFQTSLQNTCLDTRFYIRALDAVPLCKSCQVEVRPPIPAPWVREFGQGHMLPATLFACPAISWKSRIPSGAARSLGSTQGVGESCYKVAGQLQ